MIRVQCCSLVDIWLKRRGTKREKNKCLVIPFKLSSIFILAHFNYSSKSNIITTLHDSLSCENKNCRLQQSLSLCQCYSQMLKNARCAGFNSSHRGSEELELNGKGERRMMQGCRKQSPALSQVMPETVYRHESRITV